MAKKYANRVLKFKNLELEPKNRKSFFLSVNDVGAIIETNF